MTFLREMFSARSGMVSSKRVMGVLAWLVILFVYVYCAVTGSATPELAEWIIITASSLLGVDSVVSIFKKDNAINTKIRERNGDRPEDN